MPNTISIGEARRIALAAQGFGTARPVGRVGIRRIRSVLNGLGIVQIDFVNVLIPAHYLVPFSRLGPYDISRLDHLIYKRREFTEQWAHEASIVPMSTWPLLQHRRDAGRYQHPVIRQYLTDHPGYLERVLEDVARVGPSTADEIAPPPGSDGRAPLSWYRSIQRLALEAHFAAGNVCVATRRSNMARAFDLAKRVVPAEHHDRHMDLDDQHRSLIDLAARAHGIGTTADLADYYRMPVRDARVAIRELEDMGRLTLVRVEGWREPGWLHAEARVPSRIEASTLLSPFDPVVWFRPRAERLFDFEYRIEIYTPEAKRKYGYYVLPFLMGDRIVARVDLKAERKSRRLVAASTHLEPGADARSVSQALASELRIVAEWLELDGVDVALSGSLSRHLRKHFKASR